MLAIPVMSGCNRKEWPVVAGEASVVAEKESPGSPGTKLDLTGSWKKVVLTDDPDCWVESTQSTSIELYSNGDAKFDDQGCMGGSSKTGHWIKQGETVKLSWQDGLSLNLKIVADEHGKRVLTNDANLPEVIRRRSGGSKHRLYPSDTSSKSGDHSSLEATCWIQW